MSHTPTEGDARALGRLIAIRAFEQNPRFEMETLRTLVADEAGKRDYNRHLQGTAEAEAMSVAWGQPAHRDDLP